jgi:hypothetical protein
LSELHCSDRKVSEEIGPRNAYDPGIDLALLILGVTATAVCVWLTVRVINQREQRVEPILRLIFYAVLAAVIATTLPVTY